MDLLVFQVSDLAAGARLAGLYWKWVCGKAYQERLWGGSLPSQHTCV